MGRRPYLNLLALGRSPYEPPESGHDDHAESQSLVHMDGCSQEYDPRGHPINPGSKALSKQLRRAKNDILSTMGIVVSSEDEAGNVKEQERSKLIAEENDYGLAMATIDQIAMFVCPWWAEALSARIQTFKVYTHVPSLDTVRWDRRSLGLFGFYFAGMPVWAASFVLSVCRNHFLGPALEYICDKVSSLSDNRYYNSAVQNIFKVIHFGSKSALFIITGQAYMFSLLQSLRIIPATAVPTISTFLPFGTSSLIRIPPVPNTYSLFNVGSFCLNLFLSPFTMIYLFVYIRPTIEGRVYRLLRRRLPKPDRPDKLSVRVASENDLIEWTVPALGRRSEEERSRSQLNITEEIMCELYLLRNWIKNLFKWARNKSPDLNPELTESSWAPNNEATHNTAEPSQLNPPVSLPGRRYSMRDDTSSPVQGIEEQDANHSLLPTEATVLAEENSRYSTNQVFLTGEEQRMTQSPVELPEEYFPSIAQRAINTEPPNGASLPNHQPDGRDESNSRSRSNTLFSRPSSPESSPLASPRVRASLVHQNSDVITMQLELLQSHRQAASSRQENNSFEPEDSAQNSTSQRTRRAERENSSSDEGAVERTASDILDAMLANQISAPGQLQEALDNRARVNGEEGLSPLIDPDAAPRHADEMIRTPGPTVGGHDPNSLSTNDVNPRSNQGSQSGAGREGQNNESGRLLPIPTNPTPTYLTDRIFPHHRVTILSAHPVDSLSSHLAMVIASVLFYPLESLYLRHLASSFLSSPAALGIGTAASTLGLQRHIRPMGAWFGGGGLTDMFAYAGKMILVTGMEALVSASIWGIGTAITVMLGRRKFGWGNL